MPNAPTWFSITARDTGPVEIWIYDQIGKDWFSDDGVSAKEFAEALKTHKDRELLVHINSPGGSVFDGLAIFNLLKNHGKPVETRIEGLAASIASVIALAGTTVTMAESASLMIHDPSTVQRGTSKDMIAAAAMLDKIGGQLADIYAARSGRNKSAVLAAMAEEKWFTAAEAKEWNLVDHVTAPLKAAAKFDLSKFKNAAKVRAEEREDEEETEDAIEVTCPHCGETFTLGEDSASHQSAHLSKQLDALIQERRFPAAQKDFWMQQAALNQAAVLAHLKALPQQLPGGEPINNLHSDLTSKSVEDALKAHKDKINRFRNKHTNN